MKYIIEGTIKELSFDENFFTIAGTEGYAIKQKKDGVETRYNVLQNCGKDADTNPISSFVFNPNTKFATTEKNRCLLLQAASSGKKVQVKLEMNVEAKSEANPETGVEVKEITIKELKKPFPVASIIMLAE